MAMELVCKSMNQLFRPYAEEFLEHQRLSAPVMSPRASACYTPIQDFESKRLLYDFLHTNDYQLHYERFAASVVCTLVFGLRIDVSKQNLVYLTKAGQVGGWIVDALPFLNHLPAPLAPWKKTAETWHKSLDSLAQTNFHDALKRPGWNWAKDFSSSTSIPPIELAWDLEIICEAGIETTHVVLQIFTLACVAYPDFIPIAQAELDAVVGNTRLPTFADLDNLPYIHAVIEETFRWRHLLPTGLPHATTQDDWYNGYLIPKGSTIIPFMSAMRCDKSLFDAPEEFRPERWLGKTQSGNFGYGRRICPGRFVARNSLAIAIARLLWGFEIKSRDGGVVSVEEGMFTEGFVSQPRELGVRFEVRGEERRRLIEKEWGAADKDVGAMMDGIRERMVGIGLSPRA
jgi:cytochrome P450